MASCESVSLDRSVAPAASVTGAETVARGEPVPSRLGVLHAGLMTIDVDACTLVALCDRSGIFGRPWVEAGYRVICVDVSPPGQAFSATGCEFLREDVRRVALRGTPLAVVGFPPCTHLANVGSSAWAAKGPAALLEAMSIADACLRIALMSRAGWWWMENPVGRLSHAWGPPSVVFDPCDYGGYLSPAGDAYTKRTCLWTGGSFRMPEPRRVAPVEGSLVGEVESVERRSETPRGFARAVFETMCPLGDLFSSSDALRARCSLQPAEPLRAGDVSPCRWCGRKWKKNRCDQAFCSGRCRSASFRHGRRSRDNCGERC